MSGNQTRPVLVFDGDCTFCRAWVGYWQALTGDSVEYVPYQSAAGRFPGISREDFQKAVHFISGANIYRGAEAVFQLNGLLPGRSWLLALFYRVPFFAAIAEWGYQQVAAHRNAAYQVTRALWSASPRPSRYQTSSAWFLRSLAVIYVIAFASFGRQVRGLIGEQGIQPAGEFFREVARQYGTSGYWLAPSLFWWAHSDIAMVTIVWGGALIAVVAAIARPFTAGQRSAFVVLFIYYLSVVNGGQIFMGYQWDFLLLEAGFLAIFLRPSRIRVWLFQWLLFRLMFESGAVKLLSHDITWRNLTALAFHYQTQPLPTPLAWYMVQLPMWFQKLSGLLVFAVELVLPFLIFGPRKLKQIAGAGIILLQVLIILTGNYTFFNLLTIALCLFLFDDTLIGSAAKPAVLSKPKRLLPKPNRRATAALFAVILIASFTQLAGMFGAGVPALLKDAVTRVSAFGIVNPYGLFASMTTTRPELSIEGSDDGVVWKPYVFKDKPGPLTRAPRWVAPHQPRLDWQLWFAALGNYRQNPWLLHFMAQLLHGSAPVLDLVEQNPFPAKPPKLIRAELYEYRFTTPDERRQTGDYWHRELKGEYFPPIGLHAE